MNQQIKNPYLFGMRLKIKEQKWFQMEFVLSFIIIFVQSVISFYTGRAGDTE